MAGTVSHHQKSCQTLAGSGRSCISFGRACVRANRLGLIWKGSGQTRNGHRAALAWSKSHADSTNGMSHFAAAVNSTRFFNRKTDFAKANKKQLCYRHVGGSIFPVKATVYTVSRVVHSFDVSTLVLVMSPHRSGGCEFFPFGLLFLRLSDVLGARLR